MSGSNSASAMARRSRSNSVSSFRVCATTRFSESILTRHLPGLAGLFNYADEDVFEREAGLAGRQHANTCAGEVVADAPDGLIDRFRGDDVHALAEERHTPTVHDGLEPVGRELRRGHLQLEEMTRLAALDPAWRSLSHQLAGDHEAKAIALLGFFQVVRRDENRGPAIRQPIDQLPECPSSDWIDARRRLVEKQHRGLVDDRSAKCDALLPASGQAADQLMLFAFKAGKRQHPPDLGVPFLRRHARTAG